MHNDEIARFGISKTRYDKNIKDFLQDKNCDKQNLAGGGLKFTSDGRQNAINSERNFTNVVEQKSQSDLSCTTDTPLQNFKTQARDYDKEQIFIKDHAIVVNAIIGAIYIITTILMAICGKFSAQQILFLVLLDCYFPLRALNKFSNFGKCYICFKNDDITLYSKKTEAILYETKISNIIGIKRTTGPSYPEISKKTKCLMLLFAFIYLLLVFFVAVVIDGREENFWIIFAVIISISFFPLLLYRLFNRLGFDIINDIILIYDKSSFIEASFLSSKEYRELKTYFLLKTGKNLDKIPPQIFV